MIQLIRIDDRLLHGQVVYSWKAALDFEAIIIASDSASKDELRKAALKMATPSGVRLAIREVSKAAELSRHPKLANLKVLVICASAQDAYRFLSEVEERPTVNLGGIQSAEGKSLFAKAVYLNAQDVEYLDKVVEMGSSIDVRQTPSESSQNYQDLKGKFNP